MIHPILSKTYPLEDTAEAAFQVHKNLHKGKLGIRVLAPEEGLGVQDAREARQVRRQDRGLQEVLRLIPTHFVV